MRSVPEGGRLSGLSGFFRRNKPSVMAALVVSLVSIGCFLQTEKTDYVKNDQGWQHPIYHRRWETTLNDTTQKVRIVLSLPEKLDVWQKGSVVARDFNESQYDRASLEFWASGKSTGAYALSVKLNGQEIKRYPRGLKGNARWHSIPLEGPTREAIRDVGEAEVTFSLSGAPNPETDYVTFYGDAAVASRNSAFFDGTDWSRKDLSEHPRDQQGEFYARLAYTKSLFADQSLTTERIVIPLFLLNILSLLVVFRKEVNSLRVSDAFSSVVSTLRSPKTTIILLGVVFLLGLGLRVYFVTRYPPSEIIRDAALYETQARNVVSGYGLSSRPPEIYYQFFGYPLFLASLYSVFGANPQVMYLSQAVLGSLLGFIVFGIAYQLSRNKSLGLIAALLVSVYPPFIEYTARILTETLATFTLALFVYLSILALKSAEPRLIFLSGMAFGLAALARDLFFYLILFIFMTAFITLWPHRKTALKFGALFLVGVILAFSPMLVRDTHLFGPFDFRRLVRMPLTGAFVLVTDASQMAETDGLATLGKEKPQQWEEAINKSPVEAVQEGSTNIIKGLMTDSLGYLVTYIKQWGPRLEILWYQGAWHSAAILGISPKHLIAFIRLIVFLALLGAVVGLREWKRHLLLYSLIVYPSLTHAIVLALPRYSIPWMPYGCLFAAIGIVALITLVLRTGSKYLALSLIAWTIALTMTRDVDKQSLLKLLGPFITYMYLFIIEYLFVIELCLTALICFLLLIYRKKIPNVIISASAILIVFGYVGLRGQDLPLSRRVEDIPSVLVDTEHYVGHLIDLPRWTQGYDHYYLKIKLDGAQIEPSQKKYGLRVFANGEMIKEYPINNEVIQGWERVPIDKRFIEGQKKLYVSLQVFGAPDVFENYVAVFIQKDRHYGLSVFNDSTRYLSIDRNEEQNGTFLIGLEMKGKGLCRDVDLWLGSRLSQADKLSLLGDESGVWYSLGQKIRLIGHQVKGTVKAGETLRPRLYWQARTAMDQDYTVFIHLLDEGGNLRAQRDCQPQRGDYPTSLWQQGEVIWDGHEIALPPDLPAGTYRLVAGMYLLESMERLPVFDGTGKRLPDDVIPLGEIQVR